MSELHIHIHVRNPVQVAWVLLAAALWLMLPESSAASLELPRAAAQGTASPR